MMVLMHCQTLLYHRTKIKKKAKCCFFTTVTTTHCFTIRKKNINFTNASSFNFHQANFQRQKKKKLFYHSENLASTQVHWDQSSDFFVSILVQLDAGRLHLLLMSQTVIIEAT